MFCKMAIFNNVQMFRLHLNIIALNWFSSDLPVNFNISTTGHKLQDKTLDHIIITSWEYRCMHWTYVVLSRVCDLDDLILIEKLDIHHNYKAKQELLML